MLGGRSLSKHQDLVHEHERLSDERHLQRQRVHAALVN
jgi:hypothetical protein